MQQKRFLLILLFLVVLFISLFGLNNNKSYAADVKALQNWVTENEDTLYDTFINYDYIIVNNYYRNHVCIFYASKGTTFEFFEDNAVSGDRRRISSTTLESRDNHFSVKVLNPNNDNNFVLPTNLLSLEELENVNFNDNSTIINGFSENNLFYNSNKYIIDNVEYTEVSPFWRPLAETLATAAETAEPGTVLAEIVKILPLILVILVSFLGLRKALRMLLRLLARS